MEVKLASHLEQSLWLKYYEKFLEREPNQYKNAAAYADNIVIEFKSRNNYIDQYDD